jgi:hypothetical protein
MLIFYPIILAHFTQALQADLVTPIYSLTTTIAPKIDSKLTPKTQFLKIHLKNNLKMIDFFVLLMSYKADFC